MLTKIQFSFISMLVLLIGACSSLEKANSLYKEGKKEDAMNMAGGILTSSDETKEKVKAANLLGKIGLNKGGEYLVQNLDDTDIEAKNAVIKNIGLLDYDPASETLVEMVPDASGSTFGTIGKAARRIDEPIVEMMIERFFNPDKKNVRDKYKKMLILIGPSVAPWIAESLKGKSYFENRESFEILSAIKTPKVATLIIPYLKDDEVADLVIDGLIGLKSKAVDPVIKELKKQIRANAPIMKERLVKVLGGLEDSRSIPILESLSQDDSELVRVAVDRALFKLRGF